MGELKYFIHSLVAGGMGAGSGKRLRLITGSPFNLYYTDQWGQESIGNITNVTKQMASNNRLMSPLEPPQRIQISPPPSSSASRNCPLNCSQNQTNNMTTPSLSTGIVRHHPAIQLRIPIRNSRECI